MKPRPSLVLLLALVTTIMACPDGGQPGSDPDLGLDLDHDGDGFLASEDCDDSSPYVYPGAPETAYDGIDQDCSGSDYADLDGDGFTADFAGGTDCDDEDPAISPAAVEHCGDELDEDCSGDPDDGQDDEDGDGFVGEACTGGDDCDDADADIHPGATEHCGDSVDQDCSGDRDDGHDDGDGDGYVDEECTGGNDCDDGDRDVHPGASEDCDDDEDLDCDGVDGSDADGCCEMVCDCDSAGLTCGSSSMSCSYSYDSYGRVSSFSCTYSNGAYFRCTLSWSSSGSYSISCSGEGDSCYASGCR